MRKIFTILMLFVCLAFFAGCSRQQEPQAANAKPKVVVTFNAIKELTQAVARDKVEIITLIPDGSEPHDFQPTTKSMQQLSKADVLIYNGVGMEPWVDTAIKAAANKKLLVVEAAKNVDLIRLTDKNDIKEHGAYDPHTWLSLTCAQTEVQNIARALAQADAQNAGFYLQNAKEYNAKLASLLKKYQPLFAQAQHKDFVTGHAAFGYLCRDLGLAQTSVEDVFASGEPSAQRLAQLVEYCRTHSIKTIFVEEAVSPKISATLAKEVGAKTQTIYTIESSDGDKSYIDRMQENMELIYESVK